MRKSGFYWVKYNGKWTVGLWAKNGWNEDKWFILVGKKVVDDISLQEIDEQRILNPDEFAKHLKYIDSVAQAENKPKISATGYIDD